MRARRPSWRRLLGFLGAGLVVNVLVAWGCAVVVGIPNPEHNAVAREGSHVWTVERANAAGVTWVTSRRAPIRLETRAPTERRPTDLLPRWAPFDEPKWVFSAYWQLDFDERGADARGWPLRALWCERSPPHDLTQARVSGGVPAGAIPRGWMRVPIPVVLPLRPIWTGLAVNTLLYALVLWLLFAVTVAPLRRLRRNRRRRRGRCVDCGYPLGTSTRCPECGRTCAPDADPPYPAG